MKYFAARPTADETVGPDGAYDVRVDRDIDNVVPVTVVPATVIPATVSNRVIPGPDARDTPDPGYVCTSEHASDRDARHSSATSVVSTTALHSVPGPLSRRTSAVP